jgi:protein gp37
MGEETKIAWCDSTFNPWKICTPVGPGCANCYAAALSRRYGWGEYAQGVPRQRTTETYWKQPLRWNKAREIACGEYALLKGPKPEPHRVFCASLADVFDNEAPDEWRDDLWILIEDTPYLSWLLVTKRIGNVPKMVPYAWLSRGFPPNVRLLITVCDQPEADRDIPKLLALPCKNGISYEPALGPINFRPWLSPRGHVNWGDNKNPSIEDQRAVLAIAKAAYYEGGSRLVEWVIVGGESTQGAGKARPFDLGWGKDTIRQCRAAVVPAFFKQAGSNATNREGVRHPFKDRSGADPSEWPDELRVQEFPDA